MTLAKYGKDAPFTDPVVRCDSCNKIIRSSTLRKLGMCECGNRKIRNLQTFTPEERKQMEEWGIDPDFLAQFQAVDND
jgi:hypothetical protein